MKWFAAVMIAMLGWGTSALASLPSNVDVQEPQVISSWMGDLNSTYSDLHVSAIGDLNDPRVRSQVGHELGLLEGFLQGDY